MRQPLQAANHQAADYQIQLLKEEQEAEVYRQKLATVSQQEAGTGEGAAQEELRGTIEVSSEETGSSLGQEPLLADTDIETVTS